MWQILGNIGSSVVAGVSNYFVSKNEIKKVKIEGEIELIKAKTQAEITRLQKESEMDFDLDKRAMDNMNTSFKDELILIIFLIPCVMSFIPSAQIYVVNGFEALNGTPDWYKYILIGMVVVIYGMRGLLKMVLQLFINKFKV